MDYVEMVIFLFASFLTTESPLVKLTSFFDEFCSKFGPRLVKIWTNLLALDLTSIIFTNNNM